MTPVAFIDFETRSPVDLKACGVEKYAADDATEAICLAWNLGGETEAANLLTETTHSAGFANLLRHVAAGGKVVAHNARFEIHIWALLRRKRPDVWPELKPEQVVDTMALARTMTLPGSLEKVAEALRLPVEKDKAGHRLMLQMCKPRKPRKGEPEHATLWHEEPEQVARLIEYCKRDVDVEMQVHDRLSQMIPSERALWLLDQKINSRGVRIDAPNATRLYDQTEIEKDRLKKELVGVTKGSVKTPGATKALLEWLEARGTKLPDVRKDTIEKALVVASVGPTDVLRALQIRQEASKASTAKLRAMLRGAGEGDRCRGLFEFHGAGTGRWAGRRVQTQNMPRTPKNFKVADAEDVFDLLAIEGGERVVAGLYGNVMDAVSWSLRSLLVAAPGSRFLCCDFSNIEGRGLAWLAGEEWKLEAFRALDAGTGHDLYKLAYSKSFGVPVDKVDDDGRQIGKVQELALGYQGGHGAFLSMAKNYRIDLDKIAAAVRSAVSPGAWQDATELYWRGAREAAEEVLAARRVEAKIAAWNTGSEEDDSDEEALRRETAEAARKNRYGLGPEVWAAIRIIVDGWRHAHSSVVMFWRALEDAALTAVMRPGQITSAGSIRYVRSGDYLLCRLPSGRALAYPYPRAVEIENQFSNRPRYKLEYEGVDSRTRKWRVQKAYGGLLAENVTQAVARDVLAGAMVRLEARGYPVVMHVHDEVLAEVPNGTGSLDEFATVMAEIPTWAARWPIAVSKWEGVRYRK